MMIEQSNLRLPRLALLLAALCLVPVLSVPLRAQSQPTNSLILVGDMHIDRLEDHDLAWLLAEHPDDYRQVTQEYSVYSANTLPDFISELLAQANATGALGILQLGDLQEGLAGSAQLSIQMATHATQALRSTDFTAPWILAKGNHDITGPGATEAYQGVILPFAGSELGQSVTTPFFSYRTGDIEVFAVDCYDPSAVITYLGQRLSASTAKHKIIATHQPIIPVTGRLWHIFETVEDSVRRDELLNLIASYKAIVVCGHLHHYSVVRRSTASGPILQIMVNSVIRDRNRHQPYWATTTYGPSLIDHEPGFSSTTSLQRARVLSSEAQYVTDFRVADMPGYAILSFNDTTEEPSLRVYGGLGQNVYEDISLAAHSFTTDTLGHGSVLSSPAGGSFLTGTRVVLRAIPALGWYFTNWTGSLTSSANPDSLVVDQDAHVTANFEALPEGQCELRGSVIGSGTVEFNPAGPYYAAGTHVSIHARAAAGSIFTGWSGSAAGGSSQSDTLEIVISAHQTIVASFRELALYPLSLKAEGGGTVECTPGSGSPFVEGTSIVVRALPSSGWEFAGWTGALNSLANPDSLRMDHAQEVKALFHKAGSHIWRLPAMQDSYVRGSLYSGNNFNADTTLRVLEGGSDLSRLRSFLKFNLDSVRQAGGGALIDAQLKIYVIPTGLPDGSGASVSACTAASDAWTESTLNWKNAPAEAAAADSTVAMSHAAGLYSWNLTAEVNEALSGDGVLSVLLKDKASRNRSVFFASRESHHVPILELQTEASGPDAVSGSPGDLPTRYALEQNYPNPFNPSTEVRYSLAAGDQVRLAVYDMLGREVALLVDSYRAQGTYSVRWEGTDKSGSMLPTGCYVLRLKTPQISQQIKMMLLK